MIVQACLNGARAPAFHPRLPLTAEAMALDGAACIAAGAAELHIHPRDADGRESLGAVDRTIAAVRHACPGTLIGVSTGSWIENDAERTARAIESWRVLPDYASVNLSEPDAPAVMERLWDAGVGIEAGLGSVADAKRLLGLAHRHPVFRILIEIEDQDVDVARRVALDIATLLERGGIRRPILLHGFDRTVWHLVALAHQSRWSTRIGLEDGRHLADGSRAPDNAALVRGAVAIYRETLSR